MWSHFDDAKKPTAFITDCKPFSMILNDHYSRFQGHAIFDVEYLRNGTIYRHSFNEILIGTYTCPTQQCRFEWPWVSLSDLAKFSMTRSVTRSLCDSWAYCSNLCDLPQGQFIDWLYVLFVLLLFFYFSFVNFLFPVLCLFYNYCCLVRINKWTDGLTDNIAAVC